MKPVRLLTVLMTLALLKTPSVGFCQGTKDTICIEVPVLKNILTRIEKLKADSVELQQRRLEIKDNIEVIRSKDLVIQNLNTLLDTRNFQLDLAKLQFADASEKVAIVQQQLRKQKRKTVVTAISGILVAGGLSFLLIR